MSVEELKPVHEQTMMSKMKYGPSEPKKLKTLKVGQMFSQSV